MTEMTLMTDKIKDFCKQFLEMKNAPLEQLKFFERALDGTLETHMIARLCADVNNFLDYLDRFERKMYNLNEEFTANHNRLLDKLAEHIMQDKTNELVKEKKYLQSTMQELCASQKERFAKCRCKND